MGEGHTLAHNTFSDWTEAELKTLTGYIPEPESGDVKTISHSNFTGPESLDWRQKLVSMKTTKNQG